MDFINISEELNAKWDSLIKELKSYKSVAVAFSAGVDSTFLLAAARKALGENVIAITGRFDTSPTREKDESSAYCESICIKHVILDLDQMSIPGFKENTPDRCYICKKALFSEFRSTAIKMGIDTLAEGTNADDDNDYRPGMRAIAELGVKSPLKKCGFTKQEIRQLSKELGLPTWNKPSLACLATRFPYGQEITPEKLRTIDTAEQMLIDSGFFNVRVRAHRELARIEVDPAEFDKVINKKITDNIVRYLKENGFKYITLDLEGYSTGSMNRMLDI